MTDGGAATEAKKRPWTPPVVLVIGIAMVVSSAASMAGGLVMYVRTLDSLNDNVRDLSVFEVTTLASNIRRIVDETEHAAFVMRNFLEIDHFHENADSIADYVRISTFAATVTDTTIFGLGVALIGATQNDSTLWITVPNVGRPGYAFVTTDTSAHPPDPDVVLPRWGAPNGTDAWWATSYPMDADTGALGDPNYLSDVSFYTRLLPHNYTAVADGPPPPGTWRPGRNSAVALSHRPPVGICGADGMVTTYGATDVVLPAPPPPHPWSGHRAVVFVASYYYSAWQGVVTEYHSRNRDSTAVVVDRLSQFVYASTVSPAVPCKPCTQARVSTIESCMQVGALPEYIRGAFTSLNNEQSFSRETHDGTTYFQRAAEVFNDVLLIWLRPTAFVEQKVQDALAVLFAFAAIVLAFDCTIAALEVVYVARPMGVLSEAISKIGYLDTESAADILRTFDTSYVLVKEIHTLLMGMRTTIAHLNQYRSFLPMSVMLSMEASQEGHQGFEHDSLSGGGTSEEDVCEWDTNDERRPTALEPPSTSGSHQRPSTTRDAGTPASPTMSNVSESSRTSNDSRTLLNGRRLQHLDLSVAERRVTLVEVVVSDACGTADSIVRQHTRVIEIVFAAAKDSHAVVQDIHSNRICVCLNGAHVVSNHRLRGLRCALAIREADSTRAAHMAVAAGRALAGNMGSVRMKRFNLLGGIVDCVAKYATLAQMWDVSVLTTEGLVMGCAQGVFEHQCVYTVSFGERTAMLCEVTGRADAADNADTLDARALSNAVRALFAGAFAEAAQYLDTVGPVMDTALVERVAGIRACLAQSVAVGSPPEALSLDIPTPSHAMLRYVAPVVATVQADLLRQPSSPAKDSVDVQEDPS